MSSRALRLASAIVRTWTRLYTWGMHEAAREARREQIESDLWEGAHDPERSSHTASQVLVRLALGMPDDLRWRIEEDAMTGSMQLRAIAAVAIAALVVAAWASMAFRVVPLPSVPRVPVASSHAAPAPPPPPPPPAAPGQTAAADFEPLYGRTSYTVARGASAPRKIKDVSPVYPPIAVLYRLEGTATLEATVDEEGRVADARIVQSARIFQQTSIDAVKQWRFEPARRQGTAVPVVIDVTVQFTPPAESGRF